MNKNKFMIPVFLILLTNCSTNKNKIFVVEENEQKFENKFRVPASTEVVNKLSDEEDFHRILHLDDNEKFKLHLQLKFDAIEEVYFRSRNAVKSFDDELNISSKSKESNEEFFKKIIQSGVYSKVLASREHNLTRQNQMIYFMKRFQEISSDTTKPREEIERSQLAFNYIGKYYSELPRQFLIAHYQIALELSRMNLDSDQLNAGVLKAIATKRPESDTLAEMFKGYQEQYADPKIEAKIEKNSNTLDEQKTVVGDELKKTAFAIQVGLVNDDNSRVPQSQKIEPGTGKSGNITGYTFPRGIWSITFDDGPHAVYTNKIAANLQEYNIKSTFFSLSQNVLEYPQITNRLKDIGMEIANHSHDHKDLTKLSAKQLDFEILSSTDKITSVTGEKPKYFRCPYGAGTNVMRIRERIAKEDMVHVFWSVDSLDWHDRNPVSVAARVRQQMAMSKNGGGIILFHDIHPQSVIASKEIMKYLSEESQKKSGAVQVKTIGEIVDELNK